MLPLMSLDARVSEHLQHGRITLRVTVTFFWSCLQQLQARTERSWESCSRWTLARSALHVVIPRSASCLPWLPGSCRSCRHCRVFLTKRTFELKVGDILRFSLQILLWNATSPLIYMLCDLSLSLMLLLIWLVQCQLSSIMSLTHLFLPHSQLDASALFSRRRWACFGQLPWHHCWYCSV